jgi:hypothetical protein
MTLPKTHFGVEPKPTLTNAWAFEAFRAFQFPCEGCWRLGKLDDQIANADLCPSCQKNRLALLRMRQKNDDRHGAPIPPVIITGTDVRELMAEMTRLDAAVTYLNRPEQATDPTEGAVQVAQLHERAFTLSTLLKKHLKRARIMDDLERRGWIPAFKAR